MEMEQALLKVKFGKCLWLSFVSVVKFVFFVLVEWKIHRLVVVVTS